MATEPIRAIPLSNDRQKQTKTQHTDYTLVATWREMARLDDPETVEFQTSGHGLAVGDCLPEHSIPLRAVWPGQSIAGRSGAI
mgnify:CR=1 FL=1